MGSEWEETKQAAPIVCFVGTTPNIGTTSISFGAAMHAAMHTQSKVGYLCLNLKSSKLHRYIDRDEPVMSLDRLRAELKSRSLNETKLLQHCDQLRGLDNFYILYGNMLRDQAEYFQAEDIEHLLQMAADAFDFCVVEVSAYWDNAATVCALRRANRAIVVTTPELSNFQEDLNRWVKGFAVELGLDENEMQLFVSQYPSPHANYRLKDIRKETGMQVIGNARHVQELASVLDQGKLHEYLQKDNDMAKSVALIAKRWLNSYSLAQTHEAADQQQRWIRKLLSALHIAG